MWDAEPQLYWRVKRGNVWKYERAKWVPTSKSGSMGMMIVIQYPNPPEVNVDESEE